MKDFRKKPVIIQAMQYDGSNAAAILMAVGGDADVFYEAATDHKPTLVIRTLEGTMSVSKDDWVIKGVEGEFYPCKPGIFEATYETVEVSA